MFRGDELHVFNININISMFFVCSFPGAQLWDAVSRAAVWGGQTWETAGETQEKPERHPGDHTSPLHTTHYTHHTTQDIRNCFPKLKVMFLNVLFVTINNDYLVYYHRRWNKLGNIPIFRSWNKTNLIIYYEKFLLMIIISVHWLSD